MTALTHLVPAVAVAAGLSFVAAEEAVVLDLTTTSDSLMITMSSALPTMATVFRRRRGRPRKFAAPARAVTLTLPEHVLEQLSAIDADPSWAIVQLAKQCPPELGRQPKAELSVFGSRAVITIKPTKSLEHHTGVDLLPLPDGRALISFAQATTIAELELLLYDAIESGTLPPEDREVFEAIGKILRDTRRSNDVKLLHRSIIVLESTNGAGATPKAGSKRAKHKGQKPPRRNA